TSTVEVGQQLVDAFDDRDTTSSNGIVGLALQLLPTLGPEPCLVRWYGDVWTKNDLSLPLDHFDLCSRLVQTKVAPDGSRDSDEAPALHGDEVALLAHRWCSVPGGAKHCCITALRELGLLSCPGIHVDGELAPASD